MGVTIRDVAKRAGVSIATVSRALNGTVPVETDKMALVKAAAEELGYIPNPAARALLTRTTGGLGVLLPFVSGEFYSEFLNGLDAAAKELGYYLLISTSHDDASEFKAAVRAVHGRVDGLIVMSPTWTPTELALRTTAPTVFVNTPTGGERPRSYDLIDFGNEDGAFAATRYLVESGHRVIAHVRGPKTSDDARERASGFLRGLAGADRGSCAVIDGGYHQVDGYAAVEEILKMTPRPTAVFAANDYCALGVVAALRDAGLSVPGDVSVVGFDGVPSTEYSNPRLTTVVVPIRRLGVEAIRIVVSRIKGAEEPADRVLRLKAEIMVRESTGPGPFQPASNI